MRRNPPISSGAGASTSSPESKQRIGPLRPTPMPSERPWAGQRLGGRGGHIGELWLAGPASLVKTPDGPMALDALAARHGAALVGERGLALHGPRFPLLVKLIDAAQRLSLQVHPSDALARELYGPDAVGKAEAWLVIDAEPDATLVTGPRRTLREPALRAAIAGGRLGEDGCELRPAIPGEAFMIRPGTLHAIGAGVYLYEIEEPSDLTFRISDWGRPVIPGRSLHPTEALLAIDADAHAEPAGAAWRLDGGELVVPELRLELATGDTPVERAPGGRTPEILTVVRGSATVSGDGWTEHLANRGTLVVPAEEAAYLIAGSADAVVCVGSLP